jgi:uncharacterized protein YjbI with pentapeptide repeats
MEHPRLSAKELYQRYCQGERNFVGVDLSGQSLRGINLRDIDLRGANLSNTDLRGTNLTDAKLVGAKLCGAKTGTLRRWAVPKVLVASIVISTASLLTAMLWTVFAVVMFNPNGSLKATGTIIGDIAFGIVGLATMIGLLLSFYRRGTLGSVGIATAIVASGIVVACLVSVAYPGLSPNNSNTPIAAYVIAYTALVSTVYSFGAVLLIFPTIVASTVAVAVSGTTAVILTNASFFVFALVFVSIVAFLIFIINGSTVYTNAVIVAIIFAVIGAGATLAVSYLIGCRALQGDSREHLIFTVTSWIVGWGGTSFKGADLTNADCSKATFKSAHFHTSTNLTGTRFHLSQKVNLARLDKTILSDFAVQNLLTTLRGRDKTYIGKNLKGANLAGADLVGANFTEADLSQATLKGAELQQANLTKTQVLGTEFRQANLTGACLEAWNIDSTTQLDGTLCDYVYLLKPPQERRPSSGIFQPGEFTKLFEEVLDTIDLIFQNGIDWKAFVKAFDKVRVDNDGTELTIQSIENKGDGVIVVRVDVPPNTDKEKIHSEFKQTYEETRQQLETQYKQQLNAKDREIEIYEKQNVQMWSAINRLAEHAPVSTTENILGNKIVHDQSQTFQGNVNINAQNSVVNLRDISGQVSNQIGQLPTESILNQPSLKDLLTQLQNAIETDTELAEDAKAEALTEVGEIANAAQSPKEGVMQKAAKGAINALKGIATGLSDASKLASACKELLPLITSMFGLP